MEELKVKVIFKKTNEGEIIAFFPQFSANHGNIVSYMHFGQHGEASLEFYYSTKKALESEYKSLLNELNIIYNNCDLVVKQKLCYNDLVKEAWK